MKIAIITDTHFGMRSDSPHFDEAARNFYQAQFFPYLDTNKIGTVLHLGDLVDRRKYLNINIWHSFREYFLEEIQKRPIQMHILLGNHDTYFKNTNNINSVELLLQPFSNISVISKVKELTFGTQRVAFVPWICEDNQVSTMQFLQDTTAKQCFGHFEIVGCKMNDKTLCEHGLAVDVFKKFERVLSGHFHHRNAKGNILYLGCPYEMCWDDYNDPKGFYVWDTDTNDLQFIPNTNTMHAVIQYDDTKPVVLNPKNYAKKLVKLVVVQKTDFTKFDSFIDKLYAAGVIDLKIVEDLSGFSADQVDDTVNIEDTMTLLSEYVDQTAAQEERERLKTVLKTLHVEAQALENA